MKNKKTLKSFLENLKVKKDSIKKRTNYKNVDVSYC